MSQTSTVAPPVVTISHFRKPSCTLESVNQDVITSIMVAVNTSSDLRNFIHASPIFYHCFLAEKQFVLLSHASRELGPVIRDAVVLAQTDKLDLYGSSYYERVNDVVKQYHHRMYEENSPTRGVDAETAVRVIQLNRTTQFFVDLWASAWLDMLREINGRAASSLSTRERCRLSQALIRFQFLTRIYPSWNPPSIHKHNEDLVFDKFFNLFKPCELEHISEAAASVLKICEALIQCEAVEYSEPPILCDGDPRRSDYFDWFYWDLEAFRDKIMAGSSQDAALLGKMHDWLFRDENHHMHTLVAPLAGSHLYRRLPPPVPTPQRLFGNKEEIVTTFGDNELNPPYGWKNALNGRGWPLWGMDLLQKPRMRPADGVRGAKGKLERWR